MNTHLPDKAATQSLAARLVNVLPKEVAGWTLLLSGELGAGKSTFARGMIREMGYAGTVASPTYTLVEPYELRGQIIYHIDLYRVSAEEELRYLGFNEFDDGLRLVEWPERAPQLEAHADLSLQLAYAASGRDAVLSGLTQRGREIVARLSVISQRED